MLEILFVHSFDDISTTLGSLGKEWEDYLAPENPMYYASGNGPWQHSLVHINFIRNQANVIVKDAKVTFADMLGNLGGTLGVFIGLSFVGLLDFFIWIWDRVKEMWHFKRK